MENISLEEQGVNTAAEESHKTGKAVGVFGVVQEANQTEEG